LRLIKNLILICLLLFSLITTQCYADSVESLGTFLTVSLPISSFVITYTKKDYQGAKELTLSGLTTAFVTYSLKSLVHKRRPNGGTHSFPSAHTALAFCSAEFLQKRYGWKYGLPAFLMAGFVGYSRVYAKKHYVEDVIAGATIGFLSSFFWVKRFKTTIMIEKKGLVFLIQKSF